MTSQKPSAVKGAQSPRARVDHSSSVQSAPVPVALDQTYMLTSLNCLWPGFASTVRSGAAPWDDRVKVLAQEILSTRSTIVAAQELGKTESADLAAELGKDWTWQRSNLNAVLWRRSVWACKDPKTGNHLRAFPLPSFGQRQRTLCLVRLVNAATGEHVFAGSTHLAAKASDLTAAQAAVARTGQAREVAKLTGNYQRVIVGADLNSRPSDLAATSPRAILTAAGWSFAATSGIDSVFAKARAQILSVKRLKLGIGSDHDGRVVSFSVGKPPATR